MAEATEMGGVIIPSANKVVAPNMATNTSFLLYFPTSAYNEK